MIASGCHDPPSCEGAVSSRRPSDCLVPVENHPRTSRRLRCSSLFTSLLHLPQRPLAGHARLTTPTRTPTTAPTPLYYHCTVHRSLAQHPWVLRLANTSSSGPLRAFRQIIGSSLSLEERTLHDHMPADLSTHTTLPSNRPRLVSALTSTSSVCNYASLD